jgi:transposase
MSNDAFPFFPGPDAFTRMWSDFSSQMMKAGAAFTPDHTPPEAARDMRAAMFRAWSDYCEQFMRSEEFLKMMKQSLSASIEARKQLNEFMGRAHHEFQGVSRQDVDQMMLSMRHMERRVVDALERLDDRLEALDQRIEALERKEHRSTRARKTGKKSSAAESNAKSRSNVDDVDEN